MTRAQKGGAVDRLLILSCSQRKVPSKGRLPAIDRYDGPAFRVLRKYLRETRSGALTVLIVSAKYGLIEAAQPIPDYDCRMSAALAEQLHAQILEAGTHVLGSEHWQEVGVCVGKQYSAALGGLLECVPGGARVDVIGGGLGRRLTALRGWLRRVERVESIVAAV